jgi:hypothetical protein
MFAGLTRAAVLASKLGVGLIAGLGSTAAAAQSTGAEVAHVLGVRGFVLAGSQGQQSPLDVLDTIRDRTRIDLEANSELRICHYRTRTLLTLRGPLRAVVSAGGLAVDDTAPVGRSQEPCSAPTMATVHGGLVTRGLNTRR